MTVSILGTLYTVTVKKFDEDADFGRCSICGYCDGITKQIVICGMTICKDWEHERPEKALAAQKQALKHEVTHAFLNESGLMESTLPYDGAWASNEEMVDWIALQGPKIHRAWQEVGAL